MRAWCHDGLISASFTQLVLTPYFLFVVALDWAQYGVWAASNMIVSLLIGPALVRVVRWAR